MPPIRIYLPEFRIWMIILAMDSLLRGLAPASVKFVPGRKEGMDRLRAFLPAAGSYSRRRNYDVQDELGVSLMSPFIRTRLVRESEIVKGVLEMHSYEDVAKFVEEVSWRTYWKGYLEARPQIWTAFKQGAALVVPELDDIQREAWTRARAGSTGIKCYDEWVNQLVTTGWLHNHTRMWFASIWIFTLRLPWELGAAFFLEHLLDGDPASNTLSWRWVGGLHTPGKHYLARAENIHRFTGGQYNPASQLNESAPALPFDGPFEAQPFAPASPLSRTDFPNLSDCPAGLLVCPEDLSPEVGELSDVPFSSICVFNARDILDSTQASTRVRTFLDGAVEDAATRLAGHWSATKQVFEGEVPRMNVSASADNVGRKEALRVYSGTVDRWIEGVVTWAGNETLKSVSMLQPPVGPWRDAIPALRNALKTRNVSLIEYRRRWDALHWPHAGAGYFRFRQGLRARIERINELNQP